MIFTYFIYITISVPSPHVTRHTHSLTFDAVSRKSPTRNTSPKHVLSLKWHSPAATLNTHIVTCLVTGLFQDTNRPRRTLKSPQWPAPRHPKPALQRSGSRSTCRMWRSALHALGPIRGIRSTLAQRHAWVSLLTPPIRANSWPCLQSHLHCPFQPCAAHTL